MSIYDKASLVLIPSGTKTSKIFSQKPVNGDGDFTFSRSTAATRVNADGNIEKETQNLLLQSNKLNTTWTISDASIAGSQSDKDGGTSAWKLTNTAAYGRVTQDVTSSGVNTFSIYAKEGNNPYLRMQFQSVGSDAYFDLSDGSVISTEATIIDAGSESVGNGWYRVFASVNEAITNVRVIHTGAGGSGGGSVGDYFYLQDAQLEQGLVARDYIETTTAAVEGGITDNVPRLDYTDSSCPALLLEPQRTNVIPHSEYFGGGNWQRLNIGNVPNSTTSPEGIQNASKLTEATTTNTNFRLRTNSSVSTSGDNTISIFAKAGERNWIMLREQAQTGVYAYFDLTNGVVGQSNADNPTIEDYGNGWYRISIKDNLTLVGMDVRIAIADGDDTYDGVSGNGLYVWGAQIEAGSYATSYIPTYGTSVTRNHEGTFSIGSMQSKGLVSGAFSFMVDFKDIARGGSSGNFIYCYTSIGGTMFYVYAGSIGVHTPTGEQYLTFPEADGKFALVYDGTSVKFFKNGAKYGSTYTASTRWADMDDFRLYLSGSTAKINYNETLFFNTALTDQEAIDLTTI